MLISPDKSVFLLKPNLLFALKFRIHGIEDSLKIIRKDADTGIFEVYHELFKDSALDLILTFDPRHRHSCVAIGNYTKRGQHVLCLYSLKSRKMLTKTYGPQYQRTQNLVFSPNGHHLAALIVTYILGQNMYPMRYNFLGIMVYSTDNLTMLHKIQSFGTNSVPTLTPAAVFPAFSAQGEFLSMGTGSGGSITRVEIYNMPRVINLKHMCRLEINNYLPKQYIERLPLKKEILDYLLYKPVHD